MSAIAVLATYAISLTVRTAWNMPFDWLAWIDCLVIPVAMPVAGYIFWQSERMPIAAFTKPSGGAATMSPSHIPLLPLPEGTRHDKPDRKRP